MPVPIAEIQMYLAVQANKNGWSKLHIPAESSGKNIAVIGAGPAGLACTARLLEARHTVTLFDASKEFGGMIASVIPPDRQSNALRNEIAAIFADVTKERMILRLGKTLNPDFNLNHIINEGFDAVFVGMGLPKSITISDESLEGLWNAMDFLSTAKSSDGLHLEGGRRVLCRALDRNGLR